MKQTTGSIASDLLSRHTGSLNPQEVQKAQEQEYIDNLIWCIQHAQKKLDCSSIEGHEACKDREALNGDFFIAVLLKKEKLLENVLRNYFVPTKVCPTPGYDQTVYRYDSKKEDLEFIWVIPDRETCLTFQENKKIIVPAERGLLQYVLDFYDGKLYRKAKEFNGEKMVLGSALEGI